MSTVLFFTTISLCYMLGDFTERHTTNRWSQHEYGTSSLPDLSNNPWSFNARRGVHQLQTERCCWRENCRFALEGQAVSWTQGGGYRVSTKPPPFLPLACCSSTFAPGGAELLAPHGQRFQRLYVVVGDKTGGEGRGQGHRWDTEP